jgi:hypothetical protein
MDKLQQGQLGAYVQSYPGYLMDSKQYDMPLTCQVPTLLQNMQDLVQDIGTLRKPLSAYKQGLADWRSGGGDQMRHEYEQALAKG